MPTLITAWDKKLKWFLRAGSDDNPWDRLHPVQRHCLNLAKGMDMNLAVAMNLSGALEAQLTWEGSEPRIMDFAIRGE